MFDDEGKLFLMYGLKIIGSTTGLLPLPCARYDAITLRLYSAGLPYFKITSYSKNALIVFEKSVNCELPIVLKYSPLLIEPDLPSISIIRLNKYWKFLNNAFESAGDTPIGTAICGPKSMFDTGLQKFKNSFSNLSKTLLSKTENISSIFE